MKSSESPSIVDNVIHTLLIRHLRKNLQKTQKTQVFFQLLGEVPTRFYYADLSQAANYTAKLTQ